MPTGTLGRPALWPPDVAEEGHKRLAQASRKSGRVIRTLPSPAVKLQRHRYLKVSNLTPTPSWDEHYCPI